MPFYCSQLRSVNADLPKNKQKKSPWSTLNLWIMKKNPRHFNETLNLQHLQQRSRKKTLHFFIQSKHLKSFVSAGISARKRSCSEINVLVVAPQIHLLAKLTSNKVNFLLFQKTTFVAWWRLPLWNYSHNLQDKVKPVRYGGSLWFTCQLRSDFHIVVLYSSEILISPYFSYLVSNGCLSAV